MIRLSDKYQPLFDLPKARAKIASKDFTKLPEAKQRYWHELSTVSIILVKGGRFSAKSFGVGMAATCWAADHNHRILYGRFTNVSASDSVIPEIQEKIDMLGYSDRFDVTNNRIEGTKNKSKIVFKGLKTGAKTQTANLKSLKDFSCSIIEEAEEIPDYDTWEKMFLSIRTHDVQNLNVLIFNPPTRQHWLYTQFFKGKPIEESFNGVHEGILYIHTSFMDVDKAVIPSHILDKFKVMKENNPKRYKNIVMGGFLEKAEGVIYDNWEVGAFDESLPYGYGIDHGFTDPFVLVKVAIDQDKRIIYVDEVCYKPGLAESQVVQEVASNCKPDDRLIADSNDSRMNDAIYGAGFNIYGAKKGAGSVASGIKTIQDYKIIVTPRSINVKEDLCNYVWHDSRADIPNHDSSHSPDAIRYIVTDLLDYVPAVIF